MAIVEEKTIQSTDGVKKTIDENSMGMALDILQRGLYSFPIKSTIRELASNAHDALKERDVAKALLAGTTKLEDHYDISLGENGIYHASGWDPDYFNLEWLGTDKKVRIYYEEGTLRDTLRIIDEGVGLGKDRLLGYFKINYSSKRANKDTLGRFGLGSKVPLSLGVESFRVINRYNGMKFKFDVYLDKIESSIPKFGTSGINSSVKLTEDIVEDGIVTKKGYEAYWEPTTEFNGVEVQVQVKKHNKNAFFEAIESQLMYMPNIVFLHRELAGVAHIPINIAADIEYKDKNVVISKSTVYNKPHILLGTGDVLINYGFLAFDELEIETKGGAVGLIMDINDIEVTPSREAPIWSPKTRNAVLEKYKKVTETATKYVMEEIGDETDYLNWIRKSSNIMTSIKSGTSSNGPNAGVLSTLASIIDFSEIKDLKFSPDKRIILKNDPKDMFGKEMRLRVTSWDRYDRKAQRDSVKDLSVLGYPIYITHVGANKYKDRYLYEEEGKFLLISVSEKAKEFNRYDLIVNSTIATDYDKVIVPEDRLSMYLDDTSDDPDDTDLTAVSTKTHEELRKENKEIVVHTANSDYNGNWVFSANDRKISDMYDIKPGANVMYGTGNDRDAMKEILKLFPKYFTRNANTKFFNDLDHKKISAILIAKANLKHIDNSSRFQTIKQILIENYDDKTGKLTFSNRIKYIITNIITYSYMDSLAKSYNIGLNSILNEGYSDDKFEILFVSNDKEKHVHDFMFDSLYYMNKVYYDVTTYALYKFFKLIGRLHLADAGLLELSEEDKENLLIEINSSLPDYLCDEIGEIKSTDALYQDLFQDTIELLKQILKGYKLIDLYTSKYYYRDDDKEEIAKHIKIYLKALPDDESLQ